MTPWCDNPLFKSLGRNGTIASVPFSPESEDTMSATLGLMYMKG